MNIIAIKGTDYYQWEASVKPYVTRVIEKANDEYNYEFIRKGIESGEMLLLAGIEYESTIKFVCVLELLDYPTKKVMNGIVLAGDDMELWLEPLNDTLRKIGKEQGAESIYMHGRRGWVKALKPLGYTDKYTTLELLL